jgi:DNA-binding GntR family transcriptional regulator
MQIGAAQTRDAVQSCLEAPDAGGTPACAGILVLPLISPFAPQGNKAERVYQTLRDEFARGEWPFGTRFSTYELADRLQVSRRPVMDAVQRLQADGFVEVIPQVGCRVVVPDERVLREQFELSAALEGFAAEMAASRATDGDVESLERVHERAEPVVAAGDGSAYPAVNRDFHAAILAIAGNTRLAALAMNAWDLREFFFYRYRTSNAELLAQRHADHEAILGAIRGRDREAARARMESHLDPEVGLTLVQLNEPAALIQASR